MSDTTGDADRTNDRHEIKRIEIYLLGKNWVALPVGFRKSALIKTFDEIKYAATKLDDCNTCFSVVTLLWARTNFVWFVFFFLACSIIGAVMAGVHHAEVIAHKVGEPFGTLVLAIAITIMEVSLIVSLMLAGGAETNALARDTVFAAIMIILTGIIGLCLLVGAFFP